MRTPMKLALGLLAAAGLAFGSYGLGADRAFAGDEAPAAAPAAKAPAPATTEAPATKTETPFHSILMYVGQQVCGGECYCASTPEGSAKWSAWFDSKDAVMPGLKAALIADGWTKARFMGFFAEMAKAQSGECCGKCKTGEACDEGCNCPNKAKAEGAAPTGDVSGSTSDGCTKCGEGCGKCGEGCCKDKAKADGAAPSGSASDASGCTKCGEGCGCKNKAKADGAAAPTGDASGSASDEGCTKCGEGCCKKKAKAEGAAPAGDASGSASDEGCPKCPGCCGGQKKAEKDVPATTNG